jgi:hypothetical protein
MGNDGVGGETEALSVRGWIVVGLAIAVLVLGFGAWWTYGLDRGQHRGDLRRRVGMAAGSGSDMNGMSGMATDEDAPRFPPVTAYYAGEEVLFAHTETSDPQVAEMLVDMMGSPVPVVPALAQAPDAALGELYVFTDGISPDGAQGPLGFQPDVFGSAPGDDGYSPLVRITLVSWRDSEEPRLLTSSGNVREAADEGHLTLERTETVVNAPLLTWPGGHR